MSVTALRSMSPGIVAALSSADAPRTTMPVPSSPSPRIYVESEDNDDLYEPVTGPVPRSEATARLQTARSQDVTLRSNTESSESESASSARRPNETVQQFETRRQAEARLAERAQTAWYRAFPGSQPPAPLTNPMATAPVPDFTDNTAYRYPRTDNGRASEPQESTHEFMDYRPQRSAGAPRRSDVRFSEPAAALHPAVSAGSMGPEFDSISRPPAESHADPYTSLYVRPQGLSAYRISQTPVAGGLWNSDQYHFVVLIDKVVKLINHKVGEAFEAPPGLKVPKIPDPSKYSGSSSHEEFMDWLGEFLNWLRGNYICGPRCDPLRINYLGLYLGGSASDWYLTEIDNPDRSYQPALKFVDCVALLHKRFVRTATANNAVILYNAVRYNSKDGVEGLFYQLDRAASKMIERPSDYSFRRQLFNCLPRWVQTLMLARNITPEYHQLIDIRENARQIEENAMRKYEGVEDRSTPPAANATSSSRPPRAVPVNGRATTPAVRSAGPTAKPPNRLPSSDSRPGQRIAKPARSSVPRDTSTMTCYSCGQVGHISTQPVCANYDQNKARLHAQREVDDESAGEPGDDVPGEDLALDEEYAPTWGGSQYESEDDAEREDDRADLDADQARFARIAALPNVRMFAMRTWQDFRVVNTSRATHALLDADGGYERVPYNPMSSDGPMFGAPIGLEDEVESSDDEEMPDLESVAGSDEDNDISFDGPVAHGSDSDYMSPSDDGSSSSDSTAISDFIEPWPVDGELPVANRIEYMDDFIQLLPGHPQYQDHDLPAQRVTRPRTHRVVQDFRPLPDSVSGGRSDLSLPEHFLSDRGPSFRMVPRLVVRWKYAGRAPEEHLPHADDVLFLSPTVWVDKQDRFLDFENAGDLQEYNDLIAQIVYCLSCGGECTPIVVQQLVHLPRHQDGALHRTTYICTHGPHNLGLDPDNPSGLRDLSTFQSTTLMAMRVVHSATVRRPLGDIGGGITRPKQSHTTITCLVDINGHQALALFDSGSTTDSVTPEFAFVAKMKQFTLPEQVTLQLGCIGSRSKICYGTVAPVNILGVRAEMYFDLINIDRYDCILGTPFLERQGVCLDFKNKCVVIGGISHKTFSIDEEITYLVKRGGVERNNRRARPAPRETAPIQSKRITGPSN
ncbi:hypothetical protein HWV62_10307 [Athelia sp. TMB]|nr:hypothetical protein HWV62_10307 [Athelia sp. TMB]